MTVADARDKAHEADLHVVQVVRLYLHGYATARHLTDALEKHDTAYEAWDRALDAQTITITPTGESHDR